MDKFKWAHRTPEWIKENPGKPTMYKVSLEEIKPLQSPEYKFGDTGVYVIICEKAKRVYVGQSTSMGTRMRNHKMNITNYRTNSQNVYLKMREDFIFYGEDSFQFNRHIHLGGATCDELLLQETFTMYEFLDKGYELYNGTVPPRTLKCPTHLLKEMQELIDKIVENPSLLLKY